MIPAFLCIDAEPDQSELEPGERPWTGFASIVDFMDDLRRQLADQSGIAPHPTWFFRMDPIIDRCFGRSDFVALKHRSTIDRLREHGDQFAIHVHPQRWDDAGGFTYSDHTDPEWGRRCVTVAAETFERTFGERPQRASMGGRFIPDTVVDALIDVGVRVDLSVEPGLAPIADDRSFGHHATAPSTDFRGYPRHPYRVSRRGLRHAARTADDQRPLLEIPRTTYDYPKALAPFKRRLKMTVRGRRSALPLNMWDSFPSPETYWDLVARAVDEAALPYLMVVLRSDPPERPSNQRVRAALAALPQHPLARRLAFVDPLAFADLPAGAPHDKAVRDYWTRTASGEVESQRFARHR